MRWRWIFLFLFGYLNGWKYDKMANIASDIAQEKNYPCIAVLDSEVYFEDRNLLFQITRRLLKSWRLSFLTKLSDQKARDIWKECSSVLTILLGWMPDSKDIFSRFHSEIHTKLPIIIVFLPPSTSPKDYFDGTFLPYASSALAITETLAGADLQQIWRIDWGSTLRITPFGRWNKLDGIICSNRECDFYLHMDMEGAVLRGSTKEDMPISELTWSREKGYRIGGYFGEVYHTLAAELNCTERVILATENNTGSEVDGVWSGLIGMLVRNETDLAVGPMSYQSKVLTVSDFVPPLLRTNYQVFFKQGGTMIEWDAFITPFKMDVWGLILLWFIIGTYTLNFLYRIGVDYGQESALYAQEFDKLNALLGFFKAFCQQGTNILPNSLSCRALYLTGYLTSSILLTAYSGSLISKLTVQSPLRPFDSLETFLKDGSYTLTAIARSTDYTYFSEASDPLLQKIYKKTMQNYPEEKLPGGKEEGMRGVCEGHKIALFITFTVTQITASDFRVREHCPVLYFSSPIGTVFLTVGIRRNMPFARAIQLKIQTMAERGILQRLQKKEWPLEMKRSTGIALPPAVEIQQVAPIYCVLLVGIFAASMILLAETMLHSPEMNKNLRKVHMQTNCVWNTLIHILLLMSAVVIVVFLVEEIIGNV